MAKKDYLLDAAQQIHMALDREVNEDYEEAFSYYKNGVDLLLNGAQVDPNKERREAVKRKTTQYLKRAEEIFISYLQDNMSKGSTHLGVLTVESLRSKETFIVKVRRVLHTLDSGQRFSLKLTRTQWKRCTVHQRLEACQKSQRRVIGGVLELYYMSFLLARPCGIVLLQAFTLTLRSISQSSSAPQLRSLLTELLQFDVCYCLGSGGGGVSDIKCHPFFSSVPWLTLSSSLTP